MLRILNRVNNILGTMQPHHRAPHIKQPRVQPISIPQIDRGHTDASPAIITGIIGVDSLAPEVALLLWTILAEAAADQEVSVFEPRLEIGCWFVGRPCSDGG